MGFGPGTSRAALLMLSTCVRSAFVTANTSSAVLHCWIFEIAESKVAFLKGTAISVYVEKRSYDPPAPPSLKIWQSRRICPVTASRGSAYLKAETRRLSHAGIIVTAKRGGVSRQVISKNSPMTNSATCWSVPRRVKCASCAFLLATWINDSSERQQEGSAVKQPKEEIGSSVEAASRVYVSIQLTVLFNWPKWLPLLLFGLASPDSLGWALLPLMFAP